MILRDFIFGRAGVESARVYRLLDEMCSDLRSIINGNLTFADNIASQRRTVQVDTGSDYTLVLTTPTKPSAVIAMGVRNLASEDGRVLTGNVVEWEWRGSNVLIHSITGLTADTRYEIDLLFLEK